MLILINHAPLSPTVSCCRCAFFGVRLSTYTLVGEDFRVFASCRCCAYKLEIVIFNNVCIGTRNTTLDMIFAIVYPYIIISMVGETTTMASAIICQPIVFFSFNVSAIVCTDSAMRESINTFPLAVCVTYCRHFSLCNNDFITLCAFFAFSESFFFTSGSNCGQNLNVMLALYNGIVSIATISAIGDVIAFCIAQCEKQNQNNDDHHKQKDRYPSDYPLCLFFWR